MMAPSSSGALFRDSPRQPAARRRKMNGRRHLARGTKARRAKGLSLNIIMDVLGDLVWTWKRSLLRRVEDTIPWVCMGLGVAWLTYFVMQSPLTPPLSVLCLGLLLWARNACSRLRGRGGPITLLPQWLQSLLLETRPLDAMAAVAVVVDAQKGIGLLFHLLAALRLDERERLTFIDQLPPRIRAFLLAPGLLHVMPHNLRQCIAWGARVEAERGRALDGRAVASEPGDAPRAEPVVDDDDDRRHHHNHINGTVDRFDDDDDDDDEEPSAGRRALGSNVTARLAAAFRRQLARLKRRALRRVPTESDDDSNNNVEPRDTVGFRDVALAIRDCVPYLRRRESLQLVRSRSRTGSVARVVAEWNPWPTLLRVVKHRTAAWLRARLSVSVLSTTTVAAGGALAATLASSPASRRIAANSARLGVIMTTSAALATSVLAFAALHADRIFDLTGEAKSSSFSPRNARWDHRRNGTPEDRPGLNQNPSNASLADSVASVDDDETTRSPDDDDDDLAPSPWPAAAAMFCAVVCARNFRISSPADWISPFSVQLARRLFEAFMHLKSPYD